MKEIMEFSPQTRSANIEVLRSEMFDVVVVGGGITGAGVAREAALRGLRVALVEKNDFASGTSGKSARMVHGGLRYLEHYQFGLVLSACAERYRVFRMAPRLVRPTPFTYPVYRNSRNSLLKMRLGMILYDLLARFRNFQAHRILMPNEVASVEPALRQEGLVGAAHYYDCIEDDARLTLTTILAAARSGTTIASYVEVIGVIRNGSQVAGLRGRDSLSGKEFDVHARVVVNATGVWMDQIIQLDDPNSPTVIRANRGIHLVFPWEKLPVTGAVAFTSSDGRRALYALRWRDTTIVGTTDVDHNGSLDEVYATAPEVLPMLEATNHAFAPRRLTVADILSTYAGVRPLISEEGKTAYQVSRDHQIFESPSGLVSISGGKLTTFRKMAEDVMDHVAVKLAKEHAISAQRKIRSDKVPLTEPGFDAESTVKQWSRRHGDMPDDVLAHLAASYGRGGEKILDFISGDPVMGTRIVSRLPYVYGEIPYAVQYEMNLTLSDFLIRRTHILYEAPDQGVGCAQRVSEILSEHLAWTADEKTRQIDAFYREVELTRRYIREIEVVEAPLAQTAAP